MVTCVAIDYRLSREEPVATNIGYKDEMLLAARTLPEHIVQGIDAGMNVVELEALMSSENHSSWME
ncbi:hypothetical protein [Vibrio rotiferianus]|uniref:hypothetical protein n=1 Tax=Vibrio rotiferianus TaxID=190895 RepID=UPI00125EBBEB|nr:hypothetical protein [Vibrio rotiferianus]